MSIFRRWRTHDKAAPQAAQEPTARFAMGGERGDELPAPQLDHARMDKALGGRRYKLPDSAKTPEEISSYLDMLAKEHR